MNDKTVMIADMVKNLALLLIRQDDTLTMKEALSYVFNSDTYRKITNEETRLYYHKALLPKPEIRVRFFRRGNKERENRVNIIYLITN